MIDEFAFLGKPVQFKDKCEIYPPTVDQILDNKQFGVYKNLLMITQEEIEDQIVGEPDNYLKLNGDEVFPTPLEFLFQMAYQNPEMHKLALEAFKFFIHDDVSFIFEEKKILIGGLEKAIENFSSVGNLKYIDGESDYFEFQNMLRRSLGESDAEPPLQTDNLKIKRIKALSRKRDRVKARSKSGLTFGANLVAICCMDLGINPLNIGSLSVAAVKILFNASQLKEKYELDIKSLLAGADSKKVKPKYWIDELNKN